ncbi:MAG: aroA [Candidatus Aminicenantes bacterium]|nr:aroA [Candidatus Aminicenantes bacterium]
MRKSVGPAEIGGTVAAPPSKSVTQRALAAAHLGEAPMVILNPSRCDDALAAAGIVQSLGAAVEWAKDRVVVSPDAKLREDVLDCGESGLCARLFAPIAALGGRETRLTGRGSLLRRPLGPIEEPLAALGAAAASAGGFLAASAGGFLPLTVKGPLRGGRAVVDGSTSSQFVSGLLMALPRAESNSVLEVRNLTSIPYVELTLRMLAEFGVAVAHEGFRTFRIPGRQTYAGSEYRVEGDWSGAAFLLTAAALAGSVRVTGLDPGSSQPDRRILDVLDEAGATVRISDAGVEVARNPLRSFEIDAAHCPDLVPVLVPLAARARGLSVIGGADRLASKESDRANALIREFGSLGVDIHAKQGCLLVRGGAIRAGRVNSHGDHRIAMALAVAGLAAEGPVAIDGAECVRKSYPGFFEVLRTLGGKLHE